MGIMSTSNRGVGFGWGAAEWAIAAFALLMAACSLRLLMILQTIMKTISNMRNAPPTRVGTRIITKLESDGDEYDELLDPLAVPVIET